MQERKWKNRGVLFVVVNVVESLFCRSIINSSDTFFINVFSHIIYVAKLSHFN